MVGVSLSVCSCGPQGRPRQTTYPVTGIVTVDGTPTGQVRIFAEPKVQADPNYPVGPSGITKDDGSFELYSYEPGDGVPPGDYTLIFRWQERQGFGWAGPDKLKDRYTAQNTPFKLTVVDGPKDLGKVELTTQ
jgi:hypothetical protein